MGVWEAEVETAMLKLRPVGGDDLPILPEVGLAGPGAGARVVRTPG